MPDTAYTIGIDIGGTNTNWGIVSREGTIQHSGHLSTKSANDPVIFFEDLHLQMEPFLHQYGASVRSIGIGAPQSNYYTGMMLHAANMPWKGIVPVRKIAEGIFHLPVHITNDANATAIGEMMYGAAKGMHNFMEITLGTGLGSGIIANGQLIYGHKGMAGELGHTIVIQNGRLCGCGRKGCLETYASATGIVKTALEFLEQKATNEPLPDNEGWLQNIYRKNKSIAAHEIHQSALFEDPLAIRIFNYTGAILGLALANAVAITEPEAIILFGGLAKAEDFLLEPTRMAMEANLLNCYRNQVKLIASGLPERDAAILGSAALGWIS